VGSGRTGFTVDAVGDSEIRITVQSTLRGRTIARREIAMAYSVAEREGGATPSRMRRSGASRANPAYVASIISAIRQGH
jgi:hypothetical protein